MGALGLVFALLGIAMLGGFGWELGFREQRNRKPT